MGAKGEGVKTGGLRGRSGLKGYKTLTGRDGKREMAVSIAKRLSKDIGRGHDYTNHNHTYETEGEKRECVRVPNHHDNAAISRLESPEHNYMIDRGYVLYICQNVV